MAGQLRLSLEAENGQTLDRIDEARLTDKVHELHRSNNQELIDLYLALETDLKANQGHLVMAWSQFDYELEAKEAAGDDSRETVQYQGWAIAVGRLSADSLDFSLNNDGSACFIPTEGHLVFTMAKEEIGRDDITRTVVRQDNGIAITSRGVNMRVASVLGRTSHKNLALRLLPARREAVVNRSIMEEMLLSTNAPDGRSSSGIAIGDVNVKTALDRLRLNPFSLPPEDGMSQADTYQILFSMMNQLDLINPLHRYSNDEDLATDAEVMAIILRLQQLSLDFDGSVDNQLQLRVIADVEISAETSTGTVTAENNHNGPQDDADIQ